MSGSEWLILTLVNEKWVPCKEEYNIKVYMAGYVNKRPNQLENYAKLFTTIFISHNW